MYFAFLPPEVNSGRMYVGPGSGRMLAAAALVNLRQQGLRLFVVERRGRLHGSEYMRRGTGPGKSRYGSTQINDRASVEPTTRSWRSPPTSSRPDCSVPPTFTGSKPAVRINRSTSSPARSSSVA